jgi:uncharacterized protein (DUF4415 family)
MKSEKNRKKKSEYGTVDISDEVFLPENYKQRISLMLQGNILNWFKMRAGQTGVPYQNIIQMALAEYMEGHGGLTIQEPPKKRA